MFHPGRCGSTVLGDMLSKHPKFEWMGEIFRSGLKKYEWIWNKPHVFVRFRKNISPRRVFGAEIKKSQLKHFKQECNGLVKALESQGFNSFIVLKRKNYLSRLVSARVGRKIGKWNVKRDINPPQVLVPTKNDKKNLIRRFESQNEYYAKLKKSLENKDTLKIEYEKDIKENPKVAFKKVVNFLGEDEINVSTDIEKINKKPVEKRISNFEEVEDQLKNTKYEWMLYDK